LYEVENGRYRITYSPEPLAPVTDYLNGQGRFRHLTNNIISEIQEGVILEWEDLKYQCTVK
jgi:pyruvate ferredoxin oxidoreductase beta subunit